MKSSRRAITSVPPLDDLKWGPLVLTEHKLEDLWKKTQEFPQVFDDFSKGSYENFAAKFFVPQNVFIDIGPGLGLAAGFAVKPGLDAVLHLVMFDRRLRGREPLFKDIMSYFFKHLKLRRMTAMIAEDCVTAIKLVDRLGFKHEGCMKKSILRGGHLYDTHIFGILSEELDATPANARPEGPIADKPAIVA